jgi:enediyne biosynthesis protein E4
MFITVFSVCLLSCRQSTTLFHQLSSSQSGIDFTNTIVENDSINPLDMEFLYNGGGVAVGDFNNDGLRDLYFTASQVANALYLNKGNLEFKDITTSARVTGNGRWCNAASVVDINNDGWQDIYVCTTVKKNPEQRANLLYINQGLNQKGEPHFKEMAKAYNVADTGLSVHAAFFDYDRDGDLDMYLVTTNLAQRNSTRFDGSSDENMEALYDKLYNNHGSDSLGHPYFVDVSKQAGIQDEGYGLGIAVADINKDGWKDIYVTNDFYGSDLLYINNADGTFTNKARKIFKHTSQNAMGTDVADINNDGLDDIITVDMNPEDNYRKKKNMMGSNYFVHQTMLNNGSVLQYVRNTLQLNNGMVATDTTNEKLPSFSDISFYAGVAETDWSWTPSLADFDNDGFKDLIITNGYPKDVTDHDFAAFRAKAYESASKKDVLEQIPQVKIPNYAYRNTGKLQFEKVTDGWGLQTPSFSCGAVYADLDNDGDLDYVINNINEKAFVFQNESEKFSKNNYLDVSFKGHAQNKNGIGAIAAIYYQGGKLQTFENSPYRGYLSTVADDLHFGVGNCKVIDSMIINWPDGKQQKLRQIPVNQTMIIEYNNATDISVPLTPVLPSPPIFTKHTGETAIDYLHNEFDFIDFNYQRLLPHKFSQYGPSIAVGDIDNNGLDDMIVGASAGEQGRYFLQQTNSRFLQKALPSATAPDGRRPEMMGILLFDADGDGNKDLYTCSGSNEFPANTKSYQDQMYINRGGNFHLDTAALPKNYNSKSCVKAADIDGDGDLDLFVGGRLQPERYPEPVNSYIYRNDSEKGRLKFTDVTAAIAPALEKIGLVCDAVWSDFDNDGWHDLIIAGEGMPLTFLKNNQGKFTNVTNSTGLQGSLGWWTSITAGDFDNDGDMDYVAGNLGLNSFFKASPNEPVTIYAADFDGDKYYDAIPALYLPDETGKRREFPAHVRDDMLEQMVRTRKKFPTHQSYASSGIDAVLDKEEIRNAYKLKANFFSSCYIQNNGNNHFEFKQLPALTQMAPLNGMVTEDINGDSWLDLIVVGNDFGNEVVNGRYDAFNGLTLLGDGTGEFKTMTLQQSGFYVPGDGKGLVKLAVGDKYSLAATQNRGTLEFFSIKKKNKIVRFLEDDVQAIINFRNGKKRKTELYHGSSFLSQSARLLIADDSMQSIEIINRKGIKRTVKI